VREFPAIREKFAFAPQHDPLNSEKLLSDQIHMHLFWALLRRPQQGSGRGIVSGIGSGIFATADRTD
jgi:hypothetical protein